MSEDGLPAQEFALDLVAAFEAVAEEITTPEGRVLLGEVALRELMATHLDEQTSEAMSVSELLLSIVDGEPRVLVHHAVRNPGPPDWDWSLDAFRLGERGYIALILAEEDDEPGQPVYGAWEPFDSQPAFEAKAYARVDDGERGRGKPSAVGWLCLMQHRPNGELQWSVRARPTCAQPFDRS
jgi:hypothetical protein